VELKDLQGTPVNPGDRVSPVHQELTDSQGWRVSPVKQDLWVRAERRARPV